MNNDDEREAMDGRKRRRTEAAPAAVAQRAPEMVGRSSGARGGRIGSRGRGRGRG